MNATAIAYTITPHNPGAHIFRVALTIAEPAPDGQALRLPAWIPGSYMIRDFARHIITLTAACRGKAIDAHKTDKDSWRCEPCAGPLEISYDVYAWDLSVRGAHLDTTHAYFNGTSVFLEVVGQENRPCEVVILPPAGGSGDHWKVATGMPRKRAEQWGYGVYEAENYDALLDYPVEIADLAIAEFDACGIPHYFAFYGKIRTDIERICRDVKPVCEQHIRFFGEAPFDSYVFLVTAVGNGYGGLEHRNSSSLMCSRDDLPLPGDDSISDEYRGFLGLCSHEYFHAWNVKRIKPECYLPYDLTREAYTRQLWWFEGVTSYYDDLGLARGGVIPPESYLELLGQTITRVLRGAGRFRQSVAESSFDTWNKFYKQDENAPNAIVSYYAKGALIALALDLTIREATENRRSLDDVAQTLWRQYGATGIGVPEGKIEAIASDVAGRNLAGFFNKTLHGTEDPDLQSLLKTVGIKYALRASENSKDKGGTAIQTARTGVTAGLRLAPDSTRVAVVFDNSPAQVAGVSAGDELVALDGLKINPGNLDKLLQRYAPDEKAQLQVFRRDELMLFTLTLQPAPADTCYLAFDELASRSMRARRASWLGADAGTVSRVNLKKP